MPSAAEVDLYPLVLSFLNIEFAGRLKPRLRSHLPIANITATAGPAGSGTWSRPDLALVNAWRHKYKPGALIELHGFEVKRDGGCDLTSVHETLAHTRLVHFAHLVWHYVDADYEARAFDTIKQNCQAYGLGLITFSDHQNGRSFATHLDARRASPSDELVDEFIETRFTDVQRGRLLKWLEGDR